MHVKVLRIWVTLWALFTASIASAADLSILSNLSETDRKAFGQEVKRYLMENPEVIFEAVDAFKAQQAASEAQNDFALVQQYSAALFDDGFSYQGGNLEGDITLVEFIDYRCGYCKKAFQDVSELLKADGNIRLILKELPILGEASVAAARYAVAVKQLYGSDAYKRVHDALFNLRGQPTPAALNKISRKLDLDTDRILDHMASNEVAEELSKTAELAQRMKISGTPTFVMQDEMLRGYLPLDSMQAMLRDKRG